MGSLTTVIVNTKYWTLALTLCVTKHLYTLVYMYGSCWWVDDEKNLYNYSKIQIMRQLLLSLCIYVCMYLSRIIFSKLSTDPKTIINVTEINLDVCIQNSFIYQIKSKINNLRTLFLIFHLKKQALRRVLRSCSSQAFEKKIEKVLRGA